MGELAKQPDLFLAPPKLAEPKTLSPAPVGSRPAHRNLADEAIKWIEEHPETARLLLSLARDAARKGRRFGIGLLFEVVRWKYLVGELREEPKLNNNFRAYAARWLIAQDASLEPFVEFRAVAYRETQKEAI